MSASGRAIVPGFPLQDRLLNVALALGAGGLLWALVAGFAYLISLHGSLPLRTDPLLGARQHLTRGNVPAAINQFRIAFLLNATGPHSLSELGELLLRDGRYDESVSAFEQAAALQPDARALAGIADVRFAQGRFADAAVQYQRSLRVWPRQPRVLHDLGLAHTLEGDLDGAVAAFDASLALKPDAVTRANLERVKAERARARAGAR